MKKAQIETRLQRLLGSYGEVMSLENLATELQYPSIDAVKRSYERGRLGIKLQKLSGRQSWFASTRAVAKYLNEKFQDEDV